MQRLTLAAIVALFLAIPSQADLLWDNYITQPDNYDHITARSSERNTVVAASWTADDAVFSETDFPLGLVVEELRWIGARDPVANYPTADVVILDGNFNIVVELSNLDYDVTVLGSDFPAAPETYEGSIDLAAQGEAVELAAGHYYIGARIVGDSFIGQNFIMSTGAGATNGMTHGAFRSAFFGVPNWTLVDDIPGATETDFAYRVYGYGIIPEPAGLVALAFGAYFLRRRR